MSYDTLEFLAITRSRVVGVVNFFFRWRRSLSFVINLKKCFFCLMFWIYKIYGFNIFFWFLSSWGPENKVSSENFGLRITEGARGKTRYEPRNFNFRTTVSCCCCCSNFCFFPALSMAAGTRCAWGAKQ